MPNWNVTECAVEGSEKEVSELYQLMVKLQSMKEPAVKNGFGTTWLGCLVEALGSSWQEVSCRGEWSCLELNNGIITFSTESAWSPCTEVFDLIMQKFPSIQLYYFSEEPGCELYETNDAEGRFFPYRYVVEICTVDEDSMTEYFEDLESALEWIEKQTGQKAENAQDVESLNDSLADINENSYCYLHEIEII
jgi:hypothetical protein